MPHHTKIHAQNPNTSKKKSLTSLIGSCLLMLPSAMAQEPSAPDFSTAGFYQVNKDQREAINFNIGWRFHKGSTEGAEDTTFNDKAWPVVNAPHGLELVALDASGGANYQGEAWYRKHFKIPADWKNKKLFLHFEGIMGKSKTWVNGKLVKERFGGFHPIHIDISKHLNHGGNNVIAVWADNSNDPSFPPGKPQESMDFSYFGGIYRDVWLVKTNQVYFSNANAVDEVAGGGVFIHTDSLTKKQAIVTVDTHVINDTGKPLTIEAVLKNKQGKVVAKSIVKSAGKGKTTLKLTVPTPHTWTPDDPYLHNLYLGIRDSSGKMIDAQRHRVGIRTVEFKGRDGFWLNGKPYQPKLIGANRHQDFAYIGNALPNHTHWRDAVKLREAGLRIIRNAHYPQDPAFMDACDALGLFVIVNTPGWQFWSNNPLFEKRVYQDVRGMVRRDRNHPCVLLWEPILNETHYPAHFAGNVHKFTHEEYPHKGCYTACDAGAKGQEHFDVIFEHPLANVPGIDFWKDAVPNTEENRKKYIKSPANEQRPIFTREWGDCVDNWNAHNSPSRVAANWGEAAQLVQALHYTVPTYIYTAYDSLYHTTRQHFGGTLWHSFDHQRGYHPDPFWGGIMDAYRQPKYSYNLFKAQRDPALQVPHCESGYYTFIAHEMTPFSDEDVWVFSNCDEVRLKLYGKVIGTQSTKPKQAGMPHLPVVFKDIFRFMDLKKLNRDRKGHEAKIEVEGLVNGKVIHTETRRPAMRRSQIILKADSHGAPLLADGSDIVPVVAYLADKDGSIKRLTEEYIRFKVEGAGELIDDGSIAANPQKSRWGRAVALVRASHKPGSIKITASVLRHGTNQPIDAVLELTSTAPNQRMLYRDTATPLTQSQRTVQTDSKDVEQLKRALQKTQKELSELKMKDVERQQSEFENKKNQ